LKQDIKILIYGYGNPGRKDDGLGCKFVDLFSVWSKDLNFSNIDFDCNYQLNIEDAHTLSEKDLAIFVDASQEEIDSYILTEVSESSDISFTSHEASPGYIYYLCNDLFGKSPKTYLLHIKGYDWSFQEGLTDKAESNLMSSLNFMKTLFTEKNSIIDNFLNATFKNP
jgi:hydrogenase maturation protease